MKKKYISLFVSALLACGLTSCSDWLDVDQSTEKDAEEMFDNYDGFKGALIGCYSDLTKTDLYGTRLTMSNVDALASLWYLDASTDYYDNIKENYYLRVHNYSHSMAEDVFRTIYSNLYNAVLEANMVIKAFEKGKGNAIIDPKSRAVTEGEAYAMRAFLHLDILRLFGQVPGGNTQVELPYAEVTSIEDQLSYYSFDEYVGKLKSDFEKALSLLKDNDPVCKYSFKELDQIGKTGYEYVTIEDDFMMFRRYRLNYWAVKALQARMYMYVGEKKAAHDVAMEIINATAEKGDKVIELSSANDYGRSGIKNYASPSECLFLLKFPNLHDISVPLLCGSPEGDRADMLQVDNQENLTLTKEWKDNLFLGFDGNDVRRNFMWSETKTSQSLVFPTISKYYVEEEGVIPIIRLSEVYLIAIEGAETLQESNSLYTTYMASKEVARRDYFTSEAMMKAELEKEYRVDFFAEGLMFYYYKRNKTLKLWSNEGMDMRESDYILPIPNTLN